MGRRKLAKRCSYLTNKIEFEKDYGNRSKQLFLKLGHFLLQYISAVNHLLKLLGGKINKVCSNVPIKNKGGKTWFIDVGIEALPQGTSCRHSGLIQVNVA